MKNDISRITIDIPVSMHQKFKALAARKGKSMREMVVEYIDKQISAPQDVEECPYSHVPNKKTIKAMKDARNRKNLIEAKDAEDLFKKLGI